MSFISNFVFANEITCKNLKYYESGYSGSEEPDAFLADEYNLIFDFQNKKIEWITFYEEKKVFTIKMTNFSEDQIIGTKVVDGIKYKYTLSLENSTFKTEAIIKRDSVTISDCEVANLVSYFSNIENTMDDNEIFAASSGTGFIVSSNGHMVTNNHVIDSCDIVKAHYQGRELDADILFIDRMNDLAIIKANLKPNKVFSVSNEDVSLLEDIIVAGYPLGKNISSSIKTSKGSVTSMSGFGDNYSNFQIDAALNQGNSGGPIMDQKGNVVGVAVEMFGKEVGVESFNFGVKSSTLKTFANSNNFKFQEPSTKELSNKELGSLITEATIYLECWMTVAKYKQLVAEEESRKAFFDNVN